MTLRELNFNQTKLRIHNITAKSVLNMTAKLEYPTKEIVKTNNI